MRESCSELRAEPLPTLGLLRCGRSPKLHSVTSLAQLPLRSRSLIAWVALVLLVGVGHVVPALHFLFVAHHLCAEHGELVDAVASAGGAESAESTREKAGSSQQAADGEKAAGSAAVCVSGVASHSHEHCEVFAATRSAPALAPAPAPAQLLPAMELAPSEGEAREAHVDIALLHYAPKLAPPARAELA